VCGASLSKKEQKTFIIHALRTGMEVADDVLEGESLNVHEEALTARYKTHCWRGGLADGIWLLKETENARRTVIENDGIRT